MSEGNDRKRMMIEEELLEKIIGGVGDGGVKIASTAEENDGYGPTMLCPNCGEFNYKPFYRLGNTVVYACFSGCGAYHQVQRNDLPDPR